MNWGRSSAVLGLAILCLIAVLAAACGSTSAPTETNPAPPTTERLTTTIPPTTTTTQATTTTTHPTTTIRTTTTVADPAARLVSAARPVSWAELMAGAPTDVILKVSGTITEGGLGSGGGTIHVDGDLDHMLLFNLVPDPETLGLDISMDDFHEGEVTLYGLASGQKGIASNDGADMVMMFYVAVVRYGPPGQEGGEGMVAPASGSYSDGVYLVGTDLPAGTFKGTTKGESGYWEISTDANGSEIVDNDITYGQFYLEVKAGQYLKLVDVTITKVK